jgi:hypothetical protein
VCFFSSALVSSKKEVHCERLVCGDKLPELFPENAVQGSVAQV